ncbi:MAG: protein kinase [Deltaproteobacteria bacterium]|nr:protein kinase [Deltaproteobacteria bacterium]
MLQKRELQLVRLAVRRRWLTAEAGEDCLFLKRKFGTKYTIEELIRRRGYLDDAAIAELSADTDSLLRRRVFSRRPSAPRPSTPSPTAARPVPAPPPVDQSFLEDQAQAQTVLDRAVHLGLAPVPEPVLAPADDRSHAAEAPERGTVRRGGAAIEVDTADPASDPDEDETVVGVRPPIIPDRPMELSDRTLLLQPTPVSAPVSAPVPTREPTAEPRSTTVVPRASTAPSDPSLDAGEEAPGVELGGYVIRRLIGSGANGSVYLAEPKAGGEKVALKVLRRGLPDAQDLVERFHREVEAVSAIQSPHVMPVLGTGTDRGRYYMALRYVDGWTLRERLDAGEPPGLGEAVRIARDVARALVAAEHAGLVHRDVKPENILIGRDGGVYLSDFGVARDQKRSSELTAAQDVILGTANYMAPEQALGEAIDHRADIYALGATLFHVLAGRPMFSGRSSISIIAKHTREPAPDVRVFAPEIPERVAAAIARCVAKDREARFASARELADELEAILAELDPRARSRAEVAPLRRRRMVAHALLITSLALGFSALFAALAKKSGWVEFGRSTLAGDAALMGALAVIASLVLHAALALVRRGQLPLPTSTAWIVTLDEIAGSAGAALIFTSVLLGPPAVLHLSSAVLGLGVLASWVYGILLRRAVASRRPDRGVGHLLAVLGDPVLHGWRSVHVPLLTSLAALAGLRSAFLSYFRAG